MARQAQPTGIRIISGTLQGSHSTSEQDKELATALVALSNLVPFIPRIPFSLSRFYMNTVSVAGRMLFSTLFGAFILTACFGALTACGQSLSSPQEALSLPPSFKEMAARNAAAPCFEPAPLPDMKDYNGPLKKTVGVFAGALERKTVHQPHYRPGLKLCTLGLNDKFMLFLDDSLDPVTFLAAGFNAGIDHIYDRDSRFGQGAAGYSKRYAAGITDGVSSRFFKDFAYPVIFSEDPRYYRFGRGSIGGRMLHVTAHLFIAHRVDGTRTFNYSEWLGTTTSSLLSNTYHPGNERGFGPTAGRVAFQFANDIGYDMLCEFWPEISSKFKLPFTR
jgi:hypothetical protein